ncbi:hypothetical protein [Klebsiella pneumoniae]|uniref:hypothetical protein n=1 Tax=Klebsiella pneumoniae TaxID=573 RepID=UPI0039887D00
MFDVRLSATIYLVGFHRVQQFGDGDQQRPLHQQYVRSDRLTGGHYAHRHHHADGYLNLRVYVSG